MKSTRQSVFETNSSATHALTISNRWSTESYAKLKLNRKKQLVLKGGSFDREFADYNDALTKANYCAIYAKLQEDSGNPKPLDMLTAVLLKQTGASEVIYDFAVNEEDDRAKYYGSINHQAQDACEDAFAGDLVLTRFIFDPKSWLHTDSD